jgi:alanine-synthesizing transaminase
LFSFRSAFDLEPNPLTIALSRARAAGRGILDLTESNPTRAGIPYEADALLAALATPRSLRYEPAPFGLACAREAVARTLSTGGLAVDPARVVLTASTSEAYAFVFKLLADPGDEVVVPQPSYPLFEHLARLESVRPVPYRLAYDGAWHIDMQTVRAAVSPRTRAVVVVSPNNPTGSFVTKVELDELASLGLPIVSDEVFAPFSLRDDGRHFPSALESAGAPLVFALGGLSKMAGLPQLKLSWIAVGGDGARVAPALARLEVIADAFLSVGAPVQHAAAGILASRGTTEEAIRARVRANLDLVRGIVAGSPASVLHVEGGWYATLQLPRTRSEEEWVLAFLEEEGVYVHPGHFFDFGDEAYVVVSLLTAEGTLREGTKKIVGRVQAA